MRAQEEGTMMEKLKHKQQELQSSMAIVRSGLSNAEALAEQTVQKLAAQFAGVPSDQLTAKIAQKFAKLDLDQDGQLNREEFRAAFTGMTGRRLGEQELDSLMSMFDADGNEMIDQMEFEHLVRVYTKMPCEGWCTICANERGDTATEPAPRCIRVVAPIESTLQVRCMNFQECGFSGTQRAVAQHELECGQASLPPATGVFGGHSLSPGHALPPLDPGVGFSRTASAPGYFTENLREETKPAKIMTSDPSPKGIEKYKPLPPSEDLPFARTQSLDGPSGGRPLRLRSSSESVEPSVEGTPRRPTNSPEREVTQAERVRRLGLKVNFMQQSLQRTSEITSSVMSGMNKFLFSAYANLPAAKVKAKINDLFDSLDKDNSGVLTPREIADGFAALGKPMSDDELAAYMREVDSDQSGTISHEEFEHSARQALGHPCDKGCRSCSLILAKSAVAFIDTLDASAPAAPPPAAPTKTLVPNVTENKRNTPGPRVQTPQDSNGVLTAVAQLLQESKLPPSAQKHLDGVVDVRWFMDGDLIAKQGDPCSIIFVVAVGNVCMRDGRTKRGLQKSIVPTGNSIWRHETLRDEPGVNPLSLTAHGGKAKIGLIAKEKFPLLDDAVKATLAAIQTDKDAKAAALTSQPKQTVFRPRPPVIASNEGTRNSNKGWATAAVQNQEPSFNPASIHAVMSEIDKVTAALPTLSYQETTSKLFNLAGVATDDVKMHVKSCFDRFDVQKKGCLDREDFMQGCAHLGKELTEEECDRWIEEADVDGNGTVDFEEFEHLVRSVFEIGCDSSCTICAMLNISKISQDTKAKAQGAAASDPILMGRQRKARVKSLLQTSSVKALGSEFNVAEKLQKQLAKLSSGITRSYSLPQAVSQPFDTGMDMGSEANEDKAAQERALRNEKDQQDLMAMFAQQKRDAERTGKMPEAPKNSEQTQEQSAASANQDKANFEAKPKGKTEQRRQVENEMQQELARLAARGFRSIRRTSSV